jgi:tetratricopeptide (TPR) repeat protein
MKQMLDSTRMEQIFAEALAKPPDDRAAWLEQACAGDTELRRQVEELLASHLDAANALPLPTAQPPVESAGVTIGRYKLLEQIGEGGFGVVFMAEQEHPVRRRVALKIIKLGMDTRQVVARFEAERQALAMMDHPNIARVFDAGATDTGRPYFVMELVRGTPITKYCDEHHLSILQRLELFIQICNAVQHAHQKGIIHRDIKPTNVLVTVVDDKPVPKIIDFGIAKATAARLTERTLFTEFHQMIGTPEYMSPEQADVNSADIDTRSDVYSLGVLLYELLVGTTPLDPKELRSKAYAEMQRIIREVEPPRPSTRLSSLHETLPSIAAVRQIEPRKLATLLRGELDWIVMRCLEKDRSRRYETASSLCQDVERYLVNEAVQARPASRVYRFRKFIRRNRLVVIAVTAVLTALVAGSTLATIGLVKARRQERIARTQALRSDAVAKVLEDMIKSAGPHVARGRDATLLREVMERTAKRLETDLADQPEVRADIWATLARCYDTIGDTGRSIVLFQQSVDAYRQSVRPPNAKLADALGMLGRCQSYAGDVSAGTANTAAGLAMARQCNDPVTLVDCLESCARSLSPGATLSESGEPYIREAVEQQRKIDPQDPTHAKLPHLLLLLVGVLEDGPKRLSLARESVAMCRQRLPDDHPVTASSLFILGQQLIWSASDSSQAETRARELAEAETTLRDAYGRIYRMYGNENPYYEQVLLLLAESMIRQEKDAEAEALVNEALRQHPVEPAREAEVWDHLAQICHQLRNAGRAAPRSIRTSQPATTATSAPVEEALKLTQSGVEQHANRNFPEAERLLLLGLDLRRKTLGEWSSPVRSSHVRLQQLYVDWDKPHLAARERYWLAQHRSPATRPWNPSTAPKSASQQFIGFGDKLGKQGKLQEAVAMYRRAIDLEPNQAQYRVDLAWYLVDLTKLDEALVECHKAIELSPKLAEAHLVLSTILTKQGKPDQAETALRRVLELKTRPPQGLGVVYNDLGSALMQQGKLAEAVAASRRAIELEPRDGRWHRGLGISLQAAGQFDEAIAAFDKSVELGPADPSLCNATAWFLATTSSIHHRNPARAVELATRATAWAPRDATYWNTLGVARYRAGQWQPAIDALGKSIELQPNIDPSNWIFLAMAHRQLGQTDEARKWYGKATQWLGQSKDQNEELNRFRAEAESVFSHPTTSTSPATQNAP